MKLSEAIRLGAMLKPQAKCLYNASNQGTCAMGAAADAIGVLMESIGVDAIRGTLSGLGEAWPHLGASDDTRNESVWLVDGRPLADAIQTRNDTYGWTREQIADWVESIERAQEQSAEHTQPVSVEA